PWAPCSAKASETPAPLDQSGATHRNNDPPCVAPAAWKVSATPQRAGGPEPPYGIAQPGPRPRRHKSIGTADFPANRSPNRISPGEPGPPMRPTILPDEASSVH